MSNIIDYIRWRGDLPLSKSPFNEIDNLIFSELSYMDFKNIVPKECTGNGIYLKDAVEMIERRSPEENDPGLLIPEDVLQMLKIMKNTVRYKDMKLCGYVNDIDNVNARQFSALTIDTCDHCIYVAFRGTDDTIAGWREDLEFACTPDVPSQKRAVEYVNKAAKHFPLKRLRIGGHSKGGNLAAYSAIFCNTFAKKKIVQVWSNDGPGFLDDIIKTNNYQQIKHKIHSIIPKSSVVGMLLEHDNKYTVVDSSELGLMQHNGFTWQVLGNTFITLPELPKAAKESSTAIRTWLNKISPEKRREFSDSLYNILTSSGAKTFTDLKEENLKGYYKIIKATLNTDKEILSVLAQFFQLLFSVNARLVIDGMQKDQADKAKASKKIIIHK